VSTTARDVASSADAESAFREALRERGIEPPRELIADGKIHRCATTDRPGKRDGAYLLFLDGVPAGGYQNWCAGGEWENWCSRAEDRLSEFERAEHRQRVEAARRAAEAERTARAGEAREEAARVWSGATPCESHPYLTRKGVLPHRLRVQPDGRLVVPLRDSSGVLHSVQRIAVDGGKLNLPGGRVKGCYFTIGDVETAATICIVEGFATGASVHEATGHPAVVALDCGNLLPVAEAIRAKYTGAQMVICADNDAGTEGNPGVTKATGAAREAGALLAVPDFGIDRPADATDMNDLARLHGPGAVAACIASASDPPTNITSFNSFNSSASSGKKVSSEAQYPAQLGRAALHGVAGRFVEAIEPHTESDPVALLFQLLVAFGNAIGGGPFFRVEATRHYANLFLVLVGPTSNGRKGTSWGWVRRVMELADPAWAEARILGGLASGEGLIGAVRDPIVKGEVIIDEGVQDKRLLVVEQELARVLKVATREGNTLSTIMRDSWDSTPLRVMTKAPVSATGAHVSIVAHVTKDELLRNLGETDAANGFANRFLWPVVRRSKLLPEGGGVVEQLGTIARELAESIGFARGLGEVKRDDRARAIWCASYAELSRDRPGMSGAILGRVEAQTMRLALIYAVLDRSDLIREPHLRAALALMEFCEASVYYIFGEATGDRLAEEILAVLRTARDGVSRTDLSNHFARNVQASRLTSTLDLLRRTSRASSTMQPTGGRGRPTEVWRYERNERNELKAKAGEVKRG
jgi:phage/plasmid primase-like uncharacterized protein